MAPCVGAERDEDHGRNLPARARRSRGRAPSGKGKGRCLEPGEHVIRNGRVRELLGLRVDAEVRDPEPPFLKRVGRLRAVHGLVGHVEARPADEGRAMDRLPADALAAHRLGLLPVAVAGVDPRAHVGGSSRSEASW